MLLIPQTAFGKVLRTSYSNCFLKWKIFIDYEWSLLIVLEISLVFKLYSKFQRVKSEFVIIMYFLKWEFWRLGEFLKSLIDLGKQIGH